MTMSRRTPARIRGSLNPTQITALLGIVLLLPMAGCATDNTARYEKAYQDWINFAASQPDGETAKEREARAEILKADALRRLAGTDPERLGGEAAFYAGSLFQAAGTYRMALTALDAALPGLEGEKADLARMAAASATLGAKLDTHMAREYLMAVTDRGIEPVVTGSFNSLVFDLVEAYEEESRWSDTLPLLELVRDSGDEPLSPVAARWIAYIHRAADNEELAAAAARDAMARFPDDENLNTRMINFIHQHGLVDQPLPNLPRLTWIGAIESIANPTGMLEGDVGLIDLWAPWCPPCRKSFPFLRDLQERHGKDGLRVVGLTRLYGYYEDEQTWIDDTPPEKEFELIKAFAASHELTWPVGVAAEGEALFATLGVAGIPNFIVIDRQGVVRGTFLGETALVRKQIEDLVIELLRQS
jgi:thiol-disulfide isomerase/thioredoxin